MPGYYGGYYGIDMYYIILVLPAIVFALWAQAKVSGTFRKYSQVRPRNGMTGAQAAEAVLRANGVAGVRVEHIGGNLTDHFDPREGVIRLSDAVYNASTVAAIGVAAHEAGHAAQYANSYAPIKVRNAIIPVSRVGSTLSWPLLLIGLVLNSQPLVTIGILFFLAAVIFQLVTLPVEFNASTRAIAALADGGYLTEDELPGARKTLSAAAMTYVAALAVSLAQLLRLVLLFGGGRRRD
ncbi:MAG: peptidase [Clostridium sp. SCN 57-10]|nr:MAG: peptidase [Clostridium sp. SCN 57-10]